MKKIRKKHKNTNIITRVRSFSLSGSDFVGAVFSGGKAE